MEEFPHLTDSQFESVRKMVGIFGGDTLRSLAAAMPAEQVERIEAFDTYEGGLIARVQGLQAPVAEMKPTQPKPLMLKVNPYEGKEGENLHFWVREVGLIMDAALISPEQLRVAFALFSLEGRAKTWVYTREATTPGCFTTWARLYVQLRTAFLLANYEYRQRSRFLACKQWKRELHEYIPEMRVLAASLVGNPVQVSVRLADGTVVSVPGVRMDLVVKLEDFDSTESFLVLDMDKYDLILGMPWFEKHEPWIDWCAKAIGASRPAASDRALVSNVPTSVRDWGARDGRQGAYAPEEVLGVTDSSEDVAMSLATGRETKAHCQACGIAATTSPNAESRRAVWASTVAVPDGTDQAGNIVPKTAEGVEEDADSASGVGNIGPRGIQKTGTRAEVTLSTSRVDSQVPHSESETPPARPVEEQCHVFDGVSGRQVKAGAVHLEALAEVSTLLNREELSMKDFLAELNRRDCGDVRHEIDLVPGTKYCVTRQWPLPREQGEVINVLFAEKAKSGMVRKSKSPHSTPTFCVRKPNGKWRLVHAYNKLNNATVPAQTPIPRKDVLLNNMSGCTLYSALDLVDGYYQILMRESDIPLTATAMEVYLKHLRRVFEVMRANTLYANIDKCDFAAEEIKSSAALSAGSAYAPIQGRSRP
ncbi:putative Polyprotein [Phytophthora palmivora]|uniref:Polyprotein n=1 Tax=Phytophthora palmivora TaxID=4796 RepID=A0A2P4X978_9STRA|nr:putative Polyprotein [Phytophthora palmivora]